MLYGKYLLIAGLLLSINTAQASYYTVTDLGSLGSAPGDPWIGYDSGASIGYGINASGQVTGWASTATGETHAFVTNNGIMTDLGTLGGIPNNLGYPARPFSVGVGINDSGQVVGYSFATTGDMHPFVTQNGIMNDLGTLGGTFSVATGINNGGQVVGYSNIASGVEHAFVDQNGIMTDLGTLGGGCCSQGFAINAGGQVTGTASSASGPYHVFMTQNGIMIDIDTFGSSISAGNSINDSGQVTGNFAMTPGVDEHAFVTQNGVMKDLGSLGGSFSDGNSINASGQVVGWSSTVGNTAYHAFVTQGGIMTDLNTLIASSDLILKEATGINDKGQIIANGYNVTAGQMCALLLTPAPIPVPAAIWLFTSGLVLLSFSRRKNKTTIFQIIQGLKVEH